MRTAFGSLWHGLFARVTGEVRRYLTIADETGYTAHRFYVGITHLNLKPGVDGVGYKAVIAGDDAVLAQIANFGYKLWVTEDWDIANILKAES